MESNVMPHLDSNAKRNATTIIEVKESHDDCKSLNALQQKYEQTVQELNDSHKRIDELVKSLEVIELILIVRVAKSYKIFFLFRNRIQTAWIKIVYKIE